MAARQQFFRLAYLVGFKPWDSEIRQRFSDAFNVTEVRAGARFRRQTWYRMVRKSA